MEKRNNRTGERAGANEAAAEALESWESDQVWEVGEVFSDPQATLETELKWRASAQYSLLNSLQLGDALIMRYERQPNDGIQWSLGIKTRSREKKASVGLLLQSWGRHMNFHPSKATQEHSSGGTWLELTPVTEPLASGERSLGFAEAAPVKTEELTWQLPASISLGGPLRDLGALLDQSTQVTALEVAIAPWHMPAQWNAYKTEIERYLNAQSAPSSPLMRLHWLQNLGEGPAWQIRCRVQLSTNRKSGWANLLGTTLLGTDAKLTTSAPQLGPEHLGAVRATQDMPLLIPSPSLLQDWGARQRFNRPRTKLPKEGIIAGVVDGKPLHLPESGRARHTYVIGATGTGKSTLLLNLIRQDLAAGEGMIIFDPHGDLYHQVVASVPARRRKEVILIDPHPRAEVPGFNLLALPDDDYRDVRSKFIADEFVSLFHQLWSIPEALGPVFEQYFRNGLMLLMRNRSGIPSTLADFPRVFMDAEYRNALLETAEVPGVRDFWTKMAIRVRGEADLNNMGPYITSKLDGMINSGIIPRIFANPRPNLHLDQIMDERGILIVNLNKGLLGTRESRLLGILLMTQILACAFKRNEVPEAQRTPCHLYIDEFQNFVSDGVASMLSEARKFALHLTLANQTLQQLNAHYGKQNIQDAILGNVGNFIGFRLGVREAQALEPFTAPFSSAQMQRLPNFHAFARVLDTDGPVDPVVMRTLETPPGYRPPRNPMTTPKRKQPTTATKKKTPRPTAKRKRPKK